MVSATLNTIENWYKEPSADQERSILLSKLALIEFCGWLEEWMDEVVRELDVSSLNDPEWTKSKIIENTHGFHYDKHFRTMLCRILGEHKVRQIEKKFEAESGGDLELIKASLGSLWITRCKLAHSDVAAHKAAQVTVNAPSWTRNQHRVLAKRLENFKTVLLANI